MRATEQYCLDFGQKSIQPVTCSCGMVYVRGEEADEKQHAKYHEESTKGVKWPARLERPKKYYDDCSRIVNITANEQKLIPEAINKLLKMSEGEMSAGNDINKILALQNSLFYVFVDHASTLVGYICCQRIQEAYQLIDYQNSKLEEEPVAAECGVLYLWVHPSYRRQKIATRLVDVARANLKRSGVIYRSRVAVCDPTEQAIPFFEAYLFHKRPVRVYQQK